MRLDKGAINILTTVEHGTIVQDNAGVHFNEIVQHADIAKLFGPWGAGWSVLHFFKMLCRFHFWKQALTIIAALAVARYFVLPSVGSGLANTANNGVVIKAGFPGLQSGSSRGKDTPSIVDVTNWNGK